MRNNYVVITLTILLLSFFTVNLLLPKIILISKKKNILSRIESRSSHKKEIPRLGGFAIFFGIISTIHVISFFTPINTSVSTISISLIIVFLIGLYDDLKDVKPINKLKGQILSILPILIDPSFNINFQGLSLLQNNILSIIFTISIIIFIINAYNLIDGIDGLAGLIGLIITTCFVALFYIYDEPFYIYFNLAIIGCIIGFLRYNFRNDRLKIFMGDSGSLIIGLCIGISIIKLLNLTLAKDQNIYHNLSFLNILLGIVFIPVFDTIRVILIRLRQKKHPFSADRNHLHHFFLDRKMSHLRTVLVIIIINLIIIIGNTLLFINYDNFIYGLLFNGLISVMLSMYIKLKRNA